jgi:hypothetical protein
MTQDEVSGLRDIIRHDVMMDARALEQIRTLRQLLNDGGVTFPDVYAKIGEIEVSILSTLAETKKNPGLAVQFEIVEADRPE